MSRRRVAVVIALVVLALGAASYRALLDLAREGYWHGRRGWARVTGRLVDVGGHRLYISCQGTGTPAVILEAGLGSASSTWQSVAPGIAAFTRVCAYDRRGIGLSDPLTPGTTSRAADSVVTDLQRLLGAHGVAPPFVLVGHSVGALHVRLFAVRHPEAVAGLVLVDGSHEDQFAAFAADLSEAQRVEYERHERAGNFERLNQFDSADQVRRAHDLPAVPLIVLSAAGDGRRAAWQADLARLRPDASHIVVPESGHFIHHDAPAAVIEAVRTLVRDRAPSR